jgi:hypothetical protein
LSKQKVLVFLATMLTCVPLLAACAGVSVGATEQAVGQIQNSSAGKPPASGQAGGVLKTNYENALPVAMQLAVGTFMLDDSDQPVSPEQAAELIPLWKGYKSLSNADTASRIELEALLTQIQEVLSSDQLQAIAAMELTREDLMELGQTRQIEMGGPGGNFNLTPEQQATREARRSSGQSPAQGGGPPGGGGGFGPPGGGGFGPEGGFIPGAESTPGAIETVMARRQSAGGGLVSPGLLEALITFLETKV